MSTGGKGFGKGGVKKHRKVIRDSIQGITKPSLKRLAHRAGIPRISGLDYEELRGIIKVNLEDILRQAVVALEHTRGKTIKTKHLEFALNALHPGATFAAYYEKDELGSKAKTHRKTHGEVTDATKKHRFKPGVTALRDIRAMQKSEDPIISQHPFNRLVREIGQDYHEDLRFEARAIGLLRLFIENYTVKMLEEALLSAIHAKRITVQPKDMQLARRVRGDRS